MTYNVGRARILDEVERELYRQDEKWGEQNHPDGTGHHFAALAVTAKAITDHSAKTGALTYRHILEEEFWEAMAETDKDKLMTELIQVAAVAVAWVEKICREVRKGE